MLAVPSLIRSISAGVEKSEGSDRIIADDNDSLIEITDKAIADVKPVFIESLSAILNSSNYSTGKEDYLEHTQSILKGAKQHGVNYYTGTKEEA